MAKYRLLEVYDRVLNTTYWVIYKRVLLIFWTQYFDADSEDGATFYEKEKALIWYEHYTRQRDRFETTVIAQNK
jgi:hypothetical protein